MEALDIINDSVSQEGAITQYNKGQIEFHAKACFHRGRDEATMLRSVARDHGFVKEKLELALATFRGMQ